MGDSWIHALSLSGAASTFICTRVFPLTPNRTQTFLLPSSNSLRPDTKFSLSLATFLSRHGSGEGSWISVYLSADQFLLSVPSSWSLMGFVIP